MVPVKIVFHGDLFLFLGRDQRKNSHIETPLDRRTSIKDFLEALGIPHSEIYRLTVGEREKDFNYIVEDGDLIEVFPFPSPVNPMLETLLRSPVTCTSFAVDANVSKLARYLRMAGFDAFCDLQMADKELAERAVREERILLTRDRALLKRKIVVHGRLIRSVKPADQLREIVSLYGLRNRIKPFSRCMDCNEILRQADKESIAGRLEPLTRKYFAHFSICPACERIFWPGSHRDNMLSYLKGI